METVIAMAVLTILITGFLGVFGPTADSIRRSLTTREAERLVATLEQELATLRPGETAFGTSFEKAVDWINGSHNRDTAILLYTYKADPDSPRTVPPSGAGSPAQDGSLGPTDTPNGAAGRDFILQPAVRRLRIDASTPDPNLESDFEALSGRVYLVKLFELVPDSSAGGTLTAATSGAPGSPPPTVTITDDKAVIAVRADFFQVPTSDLDFLRGDPDYFDRLTRPLFSRNIAVRR